MMKSPLLSLCAPIRQGVTAWLLVLLAVPLLALSNAVQAADFIQITTTVPTAQEPSAVASVRNGSSPAIDRYGHQSLEPACLDDDSPRRYPHH